MLAGVTALQQQLTPYLPPQEGSSVYDLLDFGPAPAIQCTCVPNPFALPSYRPGWGYASGPAAPAEDAPISEADRRTNREWYEQEQQMMRPVSDRALDGNPIASLIIATHLSARKTIFGDDREEGEALRWLTFAAEQGNPDAFRLLAYRYAHGVGVAQDQAKAVALLEQGARRDDPVSMTALGLLLATGREGTQNLPAAVRWWLRAEARSPAASRYLGDAHACGAGVAQDRARALAAYKRFADRDASSSIQLGHMYVRGCAASDDKAAFDAFKRAADQGYPEAQIELSDLLLKGRGAGTNAPEAYYWAKLAELRLPEGDMKTRAAERAAAAVRTMSSAEIAAADERVKSIIASGAKPVR
jgi:TPR repeat protein